MKLNRILPDGDSREISVACQGVHCSYSYMACKKAFDDPRIHFYPAFEDVFQAVGDGVCPYGIVPIENTLAGSVTDNYDLMLDYHLFIVGSITIPVDHCLLALPGSSADMLTTVFSHPQALHQCSGFFKAHPALSSREFSNTAASAKFIAQEQNPQYGAIGSSACAEAYGLQILEQGIQNRKSNFTRFLIISKKSISAPECDRISLIFRLAHRPGSLLRTLSHFADRNLNLLKLESRPIPDSPFEFMFYCDFTGNMANPDVQAALSCVPQDVIFMKFMGNYPDMR